MGQIIKYGATLIPKKYNSIKTNIRFVVYKNKSNFPCSISRVIHVSLKKLWFYHSSRQHSLYNSYHKINMTPTVPVRPWSPSRRSWSGPSGSEWTIIWTNFAVWYAVIWLSLDVHPHLHNVKSSLFILNKLLVSKI